MLANWKFVLGGFLPVRILRVYRNADGIVRALVRFTSNRGPYKRGETMEASINFLRSRRGAPISAGVILRTMRDSATGEIRPEGYGPIVRSILSRHVRAYASDRRAIRGVADRVKGGAVGFLRLPRAHRRAIMRATLTEHHDNRAIYYHVSNGF